MCKWIDEDRIPQASETILSTFTKTKIPRVKGAAVYENDKKLYHLDTLHTGSGAHLEVYDKKEGDILERLIL
ncbi:hypothetical protein [Thermoactinomyces sp. DSM 45892]|uniref:hypothetical protein n=1 Tax=Thermoactinomyces sp. DSM 45892 TaxID=1882753 RepID=UPI002101527B|nr:hypothetical protein [Thermoactinomyces sp. DSM 45892]